MIHSSSQRALGEEIAMGLFARMPTRCWRGFAIPFALVFSLTVGTIPGLSAAPGLSDAGLIRPALGGASIPPALLCPPRVAWNWQYTTGTGIWNSYGYLLRMALRDNGTGELVYAIQQTSPPQTNPRPCVLTNSWDWQGTVAIDGSQMVFTTRGWRKETNTCNPAQNGQWPIGGMLSFQWSLDPTNTKLTIITPQPLALGRKRFTLSKIRF
jgi:hypothetical protein